MLFDPSSGNARWWRFVQVVSCEFKAGALGPGFARAQVAIINTHSPSSTRTGELQGRPFSNDLSETTRTEVVRRMLAHGGTLGHVICGGDTNLKDHRVMEGLVRDSPSGQWSLMMNHLKVDDFIVVRGFEVLSPRRSTQSFADFCAKPHCAVWVDVRARALTPALQEVGALEDVAAEVLKNPPLPMRHAEAEQHLDEVVRHLAMQVANLKEEAKKAEEQMKAEDDQEAAVVLENPLLPSAPSPPSPSRSRSPSCSRVPSRSSVPVEKPPLPSSPSPPPSSWSGSPSCSRVPSRSHVPSPSRVPSPSPSSSSESEGGARRSRSRSPQEEATSPVHTPSMHLKSTPFVHLKHAPRPHSKTLERPALTPNVIFSEDRPAVLSLNVAAVRSQDGVFELVDLKDTVDHYVKMAAVRAGVVAQRAFCRWDAELNLTLLTPQGVKCCQAAHMLLWLDEPHPDSSGRTEGEVYQAKCQQAGGESRNTKRKRMQEYNAAMRKRIGSHAIKFFWRAGFLDQTTADAFNAVAARRRSSEVVPKGPPPRLPPRLLPKSKGVANRARREARRMANLEMRQAAANQPAGRCRNCNWWCSRRTKCMRCSLLVCEWCQGRDSTGGSDPGVVFYLLCRNCMEEHGTELDPPGKVEWRDDPGQCDFQEDFDRQCITKPN